MSWGRSYNGTKSAIVIAIATIAAEVADVDAKAGTSQAVIDQHTLQTQFAADAVTKLIETVGDKDEFRVTANGHANEGGDGFVSLTVNYDALKVVDTGVVGDETIAAPQADQQSSSAPSAPVAGS